MDIKKEILKFNPEQLVKYLTILFDRKRLHYRHNMPEGRFLFTLICY